MNVNDTIHLNEQIELYKNFKTSNKIFPGWNVIADEKFKLYQISSSKNTIWEFLLIDCPKGYYSISKPNFNEDFNRAVIGIGIICGRLYGGGETRIYKLDKGIWKLEKVVSSWVS